MSRPADLGVGLVSVGWMGKLHSRAYLLAPIVYPGLGFRPRLVRAADPEPDRRSYATEALGYAAASSDYREVLADPDVQVVSICAPNFLHAEIGQAAAAAGKPFWIEKPVGRGVAETRAVAEAAKRARVAATVGFNYRNAPAVERARQLIAEGAIGRITNVRGTMFADYSSEPKGARSWRFVREFAGSGVLGDLMGHLADLVTYTVGTICSVSALTETVHKRRPVVPMSGGTHFAVIENGELADVENEDYAALLVRFAGGAVGTLEASRVAIGPRSSYGFEVYGTEGSLRWNFERMNELQLAFGGSAMIGYQTIMAGPGFGDFAQFQPGAGTSMGYDDLKVIELYKFLRGLAGQDAGHANLADAVAAAELVAAAESSAASGQWCRVPATSGTTAAVRT